jgi:exopolysaccharide production protein ExoZ
MLRHMTHYSKDRALSAANAETGGSEKAAGLETPGESREPQVIEPIVSIQLLRFIAAFAVTLFHARLALGFLEPVAAGTLIERTWRVGASGVHIFFVISGFVMVYTSYRSPVPVSPLTFLKRRFIRIYPIYWLLALVYLLAHLFIGSAYDLNYQQIALALLLFGSDASAIIGPGWTLAYELYFYLCFAAILSLQPTRGLIVLSVWFFGAGAAAIMVPGFAERHPIMTSSLLLEFLLGCWLAFFYLKGLRLPQTVGALLIVLSVVLFALGILLDYDRLPYLLSWGVPSLLLVSGSLALEPRMSRLPFRRAATLGDSSYFLYLAHVLLLDLFIAAELHSRDMSSVAITGTSIMLATACVFLAHFGHRLIELPLLALLGKPASDHRGGWATWMRARQPAK